MRTGSRFLTPAPGVEQLGLALTGVGWVEDQYRRHIARVISSYCAVLVTRGEGWLRIGSGQTHRVTPGTLLWLRAGVPHSYGPTVGTTWSEQWLLFQGPAAAAYEGLGLLGVESPVVGTGDSADLQRAFTAVVETAHRPDSLLRDLEASALLHRLIATTARQDAPGLSLAQRAVSVLDDHLDERPNLRELSRRLGVSPDTLTAKVRGLTGSTPTDYLLRRRLTYAKGLLSTTDLTVAAVARAVGYHDPAYFSRLFSRRVGVPPTVFRAQQGASRGRPSGEDTPQASVPAPRPGTAAGVARRGPGTSQR